MGGGGSGYIGLETVSTVYSKFSHPPPPPQKKKIYIYIYIYIYIFQFRILSLKKGPKMYIMNGLSPKMVQFCDEPQKYSYFCIKK